MNILQIPDTFTCARTKSLLTSDTKNANKWICFSCASIKLPFHKVRDELNTNVKSDANYTNNNLEKLDELKKQSSIYHLNTQSMSFVSVNICQSRFNEFQFMINQRNFDVIKPTETWVKNDQHSLGFTFTFMLGFLVMNLPIKIGVRNVMEA